MSKLTNALFLSGILSPSLLVAGFLQYENHLDYLREQEKARILTLSPEELTLKDIHYVGSPFQRTRFIGGGNHVILSTWGERSILIEGDIGIQAMKKRTDETLNECNVIKRVAVEGHQSTQIAEVDGPREPCLGMVLMPPPRRGLPNGASFSPSKERQY